MSLPRPPDLWTLRRAVKAVNGVLGALRLEKHPDKTFIGKIERGFDFLSYHFSRDGLRVAKATIQRFVERAARLYEQEPGDASRAARFGTYVRRWVRWTTAGLNPDFPRTDAFNSTVHLWLARTAS